MSATRTSNAHQGDEGKIHSHNGDTKDDNIAKTTAKRLSRYVSPKVLPVIAPPLPQQLPPPPPVVRLPPPPPPFHAGDNGEKKRPGATVDLRVHYMDSAEFQQQATYSAIEVLMEEPRIALRSRQKLSNNPSLAENDSANVRTTTMPNPTKVRIRSLHILIMLEEIAKMSGRSFTTKLGDSYEQTVFLYPFKLFVSIEPDIRRKHEQLQKEAEEELDNDKKEAAARAASEAEAKDHEKAQEDIQLAKEDKDKVDSCDAESSDHVTEPAADADKNDSYEGGCKFCGQMIPNGGRRGSRATNISSTSGSTDSKSVAEIPAITKQQYFHLLSLLVHVLDTVLEPMFDMRRKIKDRTLTRIAFQDLWHLFELGQDLKTSDAEPQIYRAVRWTGGRADRAPRIHDGSTLQRDQRGTTFYVDCAYTDFDGRLYSPVQVTFEIKRYDGERPIIQLPIFPLAFDPDFTAIRDKIITRGNTWLQLSRANQSTHKHYKGLTMDGNEATDIDSQIIIDPGTAIHRFSAPLVFGISNLTPHNSGETYDYDTRNPEKSNYVHLDHEWDLLNESSYIEENHSWLAPTADPVEIEEDDKILLPPHVLGWILRSRKWARFNVDLIEDVAFTSGFESLVLPPGHKDTVRALVANHSRGPAETVNNGPLNNHSIDLVRGKGQGLVILLHGAPGVGKTSTAECVADTTKRPLFPITCGDIGDTATDVERNLEANFRLAHKWGCVLLLDEADIFLQKRDKHDIRRNAIVSVFLRTLEYYSGILFLTTNRVGTFDPAFRSRIHVSLYYPKLKKDATMQIWKMHLRRTQELKGKSLTIHSKEILKFAKEHYIGLKKSGAGSWNGRQIRNAFQTAIALAEFRAAEEQEKQKDPEVGKIRVQLNKEHFQTVADASKDFDDYLQQTAGGQTEADIARQEHIRVDDYDRPKIQSARKDKGKADKKKKVELDSEESEEKDSEESGSEESEQDNSSETESEEEVPVKKAKKKGR
ncbi:hypothetical protein BKA63DRAFT_550873 [Paraphoma chrysanthemicola]|nr:hypothetical protein BKA63DRAFT_550873 [Paraphoma chrysanthemicola]